MVDIEKLKRQVQELVPNLEAQLKHVQPFKFLESKVEVENISAYVVLALGFLLLIFTAAGIGAELIVSVAGFAYPAFASFRCIQNNNASDTQWLSYWMAFAFFIVFESVSDSLVEAIPAYYLIKLGLLVWLQAGGAETAFAFVSSKLGGAAPVEHRKAE